MNTSPTSPKELIRLDNVSVCYRVPKENFTTFKEYIIRLMQGRVQHESFLALNDVNMSIHEGEVFGLIGHNGAGKSTLLKLIARVMRPTAGKVVVRGHVAPLLEIGAGFHPDLTGRENVYLNAAILGYTREYISERFESIVQFAELQNFIDAPLRTYSSGMYARLGFAVATASRPDILIVDEVLGVGDEAFQYKCLDRIKTFCAQGTSIFLVSHNSALIEQMCNRVALLDHGRLVGVSSAAEMIREYRERMNAH